jgi:hypothetical protein
MHAPWSWCGVTIIQLLLESEKEVSIIYLGSYYATKCITLAIASLLSEVKRSSLLLTENWYIMKSM